MVNSDRIGKENRRRRFNTEKQFIAAAPQNMSTTSMNFEDGGGWLPQQDESNTISATMAITTTTTTTTTTAAVTTASLAMLARSFAPSDLNPEPVANNKTYNIIENSIVCLSRWFVSCFLLLVSLKRVHFHLHILHCF
jgi:hypothetical protein